MLVLASCQDVAEETGQIEAVSFEPGYPSLHTVPPRPQLSYTVKQRRAIVDGLIADRANARYSGDVVRYRAGLSSVPPPTAPALAAVPLELVPEVPDAADAVPPPVSARAAPVVDPETEFLYEDDDLGTFMEDMVDERIGPPGDAGLPRGEPEANAAPLGTRVMIRASAERPPPRAGAYSVRAPVVTLAMPPKTAGLPVPVASHRTEHAAAAPPAAGDRRLAGRAPGVVWGMPDLTPPPDDSLLAMADASADRPPSAPAPASTGGEPLLAARAPGVVWGMPEIAPPPETPLPVVADAAADRPRPAPASVLAALEPPLAARAPGVVWGMPDLAPAPAGPPAAAPTTQAAHAAVAPRAVPIPAPLKPAVAPTGMVLAGGAMPPRPPAQVPRQAAPPAPAPVKPARPVPAETALAGRVPDPGLVMPAATADARAKQTVAAVRAAPAIRVTHAPLPAPAKPPVADNAPAVEPVATAVAAQLQPVAKPVADAAGIDVEDGLIAVDAATRRGRAAAVGSVSFDPQSATLTPHAVARLTELLADANAQDARIEIVGEAPAPALALDRALAVGLALVQSGVPADRLELTLARGGAGDHARLFLAAPEL